MNEEFLDLWRLLETKSRSIYHSIWRETFHGIYTKKNGKSVGSYIAMQLQTWHFTF
jgi:hypothetical protein